MKKLFLLALVGTALVFPATSKAQTASSASAKIINNNGEQIGVADLLPGPHGVVLRVHVANVTPGEHGIHLHSVGTCEDTDSFKKSGGHLKSGEQSHGYLNSNGYEEGDLPNLYVSENKVGDMQTLVENVFFYGSPASIFDDDGTAIVIHESADDQITQPIGNSGQRIACGVFKPDLPQ